MKKEKYIAPIIIGIITLIYQLAILLFIIYIDGVIWIKILAIIIMFGLNGVTIYVVGERINEIRGGEEDDISKYWLYRR